MRILRSDLPHCDELRGAVVVIDVLRSFTTCAYAFARGAFEVLPVESPAGALALRSRYPDALTVGAVGGGARAEGMDLGNSPAAIAALDLRGRRVIHCTAGGMRALSACRQARVLLAAGLVNASATAAYLRLLGPSAVTLVTTGAWTDRDGDEDHACAELIELLLAGADPPRAPFAERVRNSDFGRRFSAGHDPNLPLADLDYCAAVDRFGFAMPLNRLRGGYAMRPVEVGAALRG